MNIKQGRKIKDKFTIVPNNIAQSKVLSLKARGLMTFCLSLPDNWQYSVEGLVKAIGTDGKQSIRSTLKELEKAGYLERKQLRDTKGVFSAIEYILHEIPLSENKTTVHTQENQPLSENPTAGKPISGKPPAENRTQINTNIPIVLVKIFT